MNINFLSPGFLLLLLGIPALWFFPRRVTDVAHGLLRSLLFACVVLALARPVVLTADEALFQVLILDRSDSVTSQGKARGAALANEWFKQIGNKDKASMIVVGDRPAGSAGNAAAADADIANVLAGAAHVINIRPSETTTSASSLSAALAAAQRQIPEDSPGVVTLISDGLSTDRRWGAAVQTLIERGIAVNTADLGRDENDLYPAGIKTEPVIRVGQTTRVYVPVMGRAENFRVKLTDERGVELALSEIVSSTGRVSVPVNFEPAVEGFLKVRAEVISQSADSDTSNNAVETTLAVQSPIHMLYLGERMRRGAERLEKLLGRGYEIQDGSALDLNKNPDLKNYSMVMVDDRPASLMPEGFQEQISQAVRTQGMGMVFSGGKSSFGTGGYDQTAIAKVLPVEFSQFTEKRDPSAALAIIIDTSQSMAGERMDLAKQVARLAIKRLKAHDRIGIVEFYGNKNWALPMQSAANKVTIDRAIGRLDASGGTVLYPAIEEAYYGLKNVVARYRHIMIITDAGIERLNGFEDLIRKISDERINVSTVLINAKSHSQDLISMASWGKGRFYAASNRYALPEIILKQPSTMKLPAYKAGMFAVTGKGGEGWWDQVDRTALPPLSGYVETKRRPGAEVVIEVEGSAHPVLSSWQYGLGRVTAFMTEPVGEGTRSWQDWSGYGRMLARVINRTADDSRVFIYDIKRDDRLVEVTAKRSSAAANVYPAATVVRDDGQEQSPLKFQRMAPGYFVARFPAAPGEELRLQATARNERGEPLSQTRLVSSAAADVWAEKQVDVLNALNLDALSEATSGERIDPAQPQSAQFVPGVAANRGALTLFKVWPYALLLALLLYLTELIYRRWPKS